MKRIKTRFCWLHPTWSTVFSSGYYKWYIYKLEFIQKRATKVIRNLGTRTLEEQLKQVKMFSLEKGKGRGIET